MFAHLERGDDAAYLAAEGSIRLSDNDARLESLTVENSPVAWEAGRVSAWVNFGEPGVLDVDYHRANNDMKFGPWDSSLGYTHVGWSGNPREKFFCFFPLRVYGKGGKESVEMKLLFRPITNLNVSVEVVSTNLTVQTFNRKLRPKPQPKSESKLD